MNSSDVVDKQLDAVEENMEMITPPQARKPKISIQINGQESPFNNDVDDNENENRNNNTNEDETNQAFKGDITEHLPRSLSAFRLYQGDLTAQIFDTNEEDVDLMTSILESTGVTDIDPTILRNMAKALTKHMTE